MTDVATTPIASSDAPTKPVGPGFEVTMTRTFQAPPALVFDCFTDPVHFAKWWGPLQCENTVYELDARPGGNISLRMAGPGYDHVMGGEFVELDRPRRLVFRAKAFKGPDGEWQMIHRTTLTFEDRDGATRMTSHTVVETAKGDLVLGALGGMRAGWGQSMERLGDLVGGGGKTDLEIGDKTIVLRRAFDAPVAMVWQALTTPDALQRWCFGGDSTIDEMDVRPGGKWSLWVTGLDGERHRFWGKYVEVEPPSRLVMTQGFDAHADVPVVQTLTNEWGRTLLTRTMTFPDNSYRDGMLGSSYDTHSAANYDKLAKMLKG